MNSAPIQITEDKSKVRFEFLSVLAHELKAPISAVEGYLDLLRNGSVKENPELEEDVLDRCLARIRGMRKLIDDLLDLTRIESGQRVRRLKLLDLTALAQWALETAKSEADRRGIRLELEAPETLWFLADRNELEIMLNNLISNAVKYNREAGRVIVTLTRTDAAVRIRVEDTGIGIAKEDVATLFHEFVRVKSEETQHVLGSGLGLSILKKLATLYDGSIEVQSEPGRGSTFTITLREPHLDPPEPARETGLCADFTR